MFCFSCSLYSCLTPFNTKSCIYTPGEIHSINYINFHALDNHQTCIMSLVTFGYSFNIITVNGMFDPRQRTLRPHFLEILVLTVPLKCCPREARCHSEVEHT